MVFEHNSTPIIAALGKQRQENPWSLMATQPNQLLTSRFSKRPQKNKVRKWVETLTSLTSGLHTHTHHLHHQNGKKNPANHESGKWLISRIYKELQLYKNKINLI